MTPNHKGKEHSRDLLFAEHVLLASQMAAADPCVANKRKYASVACNSRNPQPHKGHMLGCLSG
jgi:hypothetical protein